MNLDNFNPARARFHFETISDWHPDTVELLKRTALDKVDELKALAVDRLAPAYSLVTRVKTQAGVKHFVLAVTDDDDGGLIVYAEVESIDVIRRLFGPGGLVDIDPIRMADPEAN